MHNKRLINGQKLLLHSEPKKSTSLFDQMARQLGVIGLNVAHHYYGAFATQNPKAVVRLRGLPEAALHKMQEALEQGKEGRGAITLTTKVPNEPIEGQLWFDKAENQVMMETGEGSLPWASRGQRVLPRFGNPPPPPEAWVSSHEILERRRQQQSPEARAADDRRAREYEAHQQEERDVREYLKRLKLEEEEPRTTLFDFLVTRPLRRLWQSLRDITGI